MRAPRLLLVFALGIALVLVPSRAWSQELTSSSGASAPPPRVEVGPTRPDWSGGPARGFAAVTFDLVGISERTELDLGYGRPHYMWIGAQVDAALSLRGGGAFGGLRASAPWGFVRLGPRFWTSTSQKLLPPQESYSRAQLDLNEGLRSKYLSLDGELGFAIPLPFGSIGAVITAYGLLGVPDGFNVFEESLRTIVAPPFVGRARVTYLAPIGDPPTFRIGGLAEVVYNPGREYVNVRLGPAVTASLTHHLEALASIALSVYNKDEIGISGADLGQIGLRYRWATGDLWPEFP